MCAGLGKNKTEQNINTAEILSFFKIPPDSFPQSPETAAKEIILVTMAMTVITMQLPGLSAFLCQGLKVVLYMCRQFNFIVPIISLSK